MAYESSVFGQMSADSSAQMLFPGETNLDILWGFEKCLKQWFRVQGKCAPPKGDAHCPPYPVQVDDNCELVSVNLTSLFNSGVNQNNILLPYCDEDKHILIVSNGLAIAMSPFAVPMGLQSPAANANYVGLSCTSSVTPNTDYTFRIPFVLPANVAPQTVNMILQFDIIGDLVDILVNNNSTGNSMNGPLSKQIILTNNFISDLNVIEVIVNSGSSGDLAMMMQKVDIKMCIATGNYAPGFGPQCSYSVLTNVQACDAEDVCRILKIKQLVFPIQSIKIITNGVTDINCYIDVTSTLENCIECCDFLIDENVTDSWGASCEAIDDNSYDSLIVAIVTPMSTMTESSEFSSAFSSSFD